jgi:hypothetical protein
MLDATRATAADTEEDIKVPVWSNGLRTSGLLAILM